MDSARTRTLQRALEACGSSREALAHALAVSLHDLARWLEGRETPPSRVYLDALDVVARGPYRRSA
jgi:DNA-binding transcriptional regulator YiaG